MPIQAYMDAVLNDPYFSQDERKSYRGDTPTKKMLYDMGHVIHFPVDGGKFFISAFQLKHKVSASLQGGLGLQKQCDITEHFFVVTDCGYLDSNKENQWPMQTCHLIFPPIPGHLPDFLSHLSSQRIYDQEAVITCLEHGYRVQEAIDGLAPPIVMYDAEEGFARIQRGTDIAWFSARDPENLPQLPPLNSRVVPHPYERNFLLTLHIGQWVQMLQKKMDSQLDKILKKGGSYRDANFDLSEEELRFLQEAYDHHETIAEQPVVAAVARTMSPQDLHWVHEPKNTDSYERRHHLPDSNEQGPLRDGSGELKHRYLRVPNVSK